MVADDVHDALNDDGDSAGDSDQTVVRVSAEHEATFNWNDCGTADSTTWRRLLTDIDGSAQGISRGPMNHMRQILAQIQYYAQTTITVWSGRSNWK